MAIDVTGASGWTSAEAPTTMAREAAEMDRFENMLRSKRRIAGFRGSRTARGVNGVRGKLVLLWKDASRRVAMLKERRGAEADGEDAECGVCRRRREDEVDPKAKMAMSMGAVVASTPISALRVASQSQTYRHGQRLPLGCCWK